jgi:cysteine sulfinate desulfinase/cysteine desulfurase-like protein
MFVIKNNKSGNFQPINALNDLEKHTYINVHIDHVITASRILAKERYIKGQDKVCAQLRFNLC